MLMRKPIIPDDDASKCFFSDMECKDMVVREIRAFRLRKQDKRVQERPLHPQLVQGTAVGRVGPARKQFPRERHSGRSPQER